MIASERLKELDGVIPHAPTHVYAAMEMWHLRNALPLIADVVEAAENHVRSDVWIKGEPLHGPSIYTELDSHTTASEALVGALTALRDSLGGDAES